MNEQEDLLAAVQSINDLTDQRHIQEIRRRVELLNLKNPKNERIFKEARRKGVL